MYPVLMEHVTHTPFIGTGIKIMLTGITTQNSKIKIFGFSLFLDFKYIQFHYF